MNRNISIALLLMIITSGISWAVSLTKSELTADGRGVKIQACAPTVANDALLTGNSQTINVTDANCWVAYTAADTKFRTMTTATKRGVQHTLPGGSWRTETVSNYKYLNFSSTGGTGTFRSNKP